MRYVKTSFQDALIHFAFPPFNFFPTPQDTFIDGFGLQWSLRLSSTAHRNLTRDPGLADFSFERCIIKSQLGGWRIRSAKTIKESKLVRKLVVLSPTGPESARTVVVTTYSTLYAREIAKSKRKFVIQERQEEGNGPKRRKGDDGAASAQRESRPIQDNPRGAGFRPMGHVGG